MAIQGAFRHTVFWHLFFQAMTKSRWIGLLPRVQICYLAGLVNTACYVPNTA